MDDVVIVEAARTPVGRFRGSFKDVRADHLGAAVLGALVARAGVEPEQVDDVVFGCVSQVGEQCGNIARTALLSAGWPEAIPGMTVDRKCGSSEAAVHVAIGSIAAGQADMVIAGGAENMTRVPMGGNRDVHGKPFGWRLNERFALTSQGEAAERLCDLWQLDRDALDDYAMQSHGRAAHAADAGHFDREIVPVVLADWGEREAGAQGLISRDETIRRDSSRERLAGLKTSFRTEGGRVTAGNASQISDGAAALLLSSAGHARRLGLRARARIVASATVGSDPVLMLNGP
ncbi:MAG: thiolase family protein, partial [Betaproteobacteria bacterium]